MVIGMNRIKALNVVKLLLFYRCLYLFSCYWQLNEKKNETDTTPGPETESSQKTASGDFSEKCQSASEPEPSQTKHSLKINTFLNFNLRQGDYMNPLNFVDPMGKLYARFRFIEKPVTYKTSIPENPDYKPGKTRAEVPLFEIVWKYIKDEGSGKYYWMPDIHISLDVYIWYLRNSLYTKEHEWRHAVDMLIGFASIIDRLRRIERETKVYLDELKDLSQLKHHEKEIEQYIESELKGFIEHSGFKRDSLLSPYFLWYDLLDWLIDRILSRSGGEKYENEYIWKDN